MLESLIPIIFVLIFIIAILAAVFDKPKIAEKAELSIIVLTVLVLLIEVIIY